MGAIVNLIDAILFLFFIVIAIFAPLLDGQTCLPEHYYPKVLADLKSWYSIEFGDYLVVERPYFFVGLVWMELLLLWPLSVVNLFGLTYGKSWFNTTCLIFGVSMFSSMDNFLPTQWCAGFALRKRNRFNHPDEFESVRSLNLGCNNVRDDWFTQGIGEDDDDVLPLHVFGCISRSPWHILSPKQDLNYWQKTCTGWEKEGLNQ